MPVTLRPAEDHDFDYCWSLYAAEAAWMIELMNLDNDAQALHFRKRWVASEVQIIASDDADAGWLQTRMDGSALFLVQLFIAKMCQGRGIGTEVMQILISTAERARQAMTLGVVKTNPALRLYKRLGFYVTGDDERKYFMRRESGLASPIANLRP